MPCLVSIIPATIVLIVPSEWGTTSFLRKMNVRTDMILDALRAGYTVLHTDVDVVFLKDPIPDLKVGG